MFLHLRKYTPLYITAIISLLVISCGPSKGYLAGASTYEDEEQMWNPAYRVYHISDKTTRFHFIIPPGDILFVRNSKTRKFEASAEILYQIITAGGKENKIINKGNVIINKEGDKIPTKAIIGYFDVDIPDGSYYYAKVILNDKLRKHQFENLLTIDKKNKDSKENFIITDSINNVLFMDIISENMKIKISSERINSPTLFLTKFTSISDYPTPIYIERKTKRMKINKDTTYAIQTDKLIEIKKKGIYHIRRDTTNLYGITLLNFYQGYPLIAQRKNLAPPMRYITSDEEFTELAVGSDISKLNTEKIWALMSNDLPKTEKLLTTFFKRVQFSNIYFTSYKEGWRTDRGLVYTIFGPPTNIYKNPKEEQWLYGLDNQVLEFKFTFTKISNPLTDNDFILTRDDGKKEIWQKAVEYWRKGKVFDEREIVRLQEEKARQFNNRNNYWYPNYYRRY